MQVRTTFDSLGVNHDIKKALHLLGYDSPTPVQEMVLSQMDSRKDLCVKAKTGSGKTAAFGIPICESVDWNRNEPQALIIVPTRELAVQVGEELNLIGKFKRLKTLTIFGKMPMAHQELSLKQKTHIVVGTPGRIYDLIQRGSLKLNEIHTVVIDEADEMFFIGLREQVEAILDCIPDEYRMMLFSATLNEEVVDLASAYMHEINRIEVSDEKEELPSIKQSAIMTNEKEKDRLLSYVLMDKNPDSCIIFANTQSEIDEIYHSMKKKGYPCRKLHGGMRQKERLQVMEQFKRKEFRYLVASDVASRGIDIKDVSLVINYDLARGAENYTHRIGRTGRNGATGEAITFYLPREEERLEQFEEITGQKMDRVEMDLLEIHAEKKREFEEKLSQKQKAEEKKGAGLSREITRVHINAGKKSKIRTCEIVASICGINGMTAEDIGVIEITDTATFVEILNKKGNLVLKELPKKTIKGRTRKVNRAR